MISAPFSLVASFIGNVRFLCPSYFEMYVGVIREFLEMSPGIPWSRMQAEARNVFLGSYHSLSRSKPLSRHIRNWSLTPNSTDSFLLMDDGWQCVPCHRSGLWLSVPHAANESSFGVLDNTYSSLALWVGGLGGVDLGISASMSLNAATRAWVQAFAITESTSRVTPCLLEGPTSPGLLIWTSGGLLLGHMGTCVYPATRGSRLH